VDLILKGLLFFKFGQKKFETMKCQENQLSCTNSVATNPLAFDFPGNLQRSSGVPGGAWIRWFGDVS